LQPNLPNISIGYSIKISSVAPAVRPVARRSPNLPKAIPSTSHLKIAKRGVDLSELVYIGNQQQIWLFHHKKSDAGRVGSYTLSFQS
jgi:hypothetical protein